MKLEKGHISERSLLFAVFCFLQGSMLRTAFIVGITKNDSWIVAFTGLAFSLLLVAIYAALLRPYQQKNLFEINELIFGPVLGKMFSALYLFFFLSLAALNTFDLGSFVVGNMMPETPFAAIIILFLLVCIYAIRKGIENLIWLSSFLCVVTMSSLIINIILILSDINFDFLKPYFQLPFAKYVQGTVTVTAIPMGEILAFTMITPMLGKNKKSGRAMAIGLAVASVTLAIIIVRDIGTLGPLVGIVRLPSFESIRYISYAGVLTRMESLYAIILISLFLFKVVILLYASVLGLAQLLNLKNYTTLSLIIGTFVFYYSLIVTKSVMENEDWGATTAPFFSLTFELILPVITLVAANVKKTIKKREAEQ